MERTAKKSQTMNAHYIAAFYQRHPERRKEYRVREAIKTLKSAGYTVLKTEPERPHTAPDMA